MQSLPLSIRTARLLMGGGFFFLCALGVVQAGPPVPRMDFVPPAAGTYRLEKIQRATDGAVLDAAGKRRRLAEFTQGKVTLLAFMYSSCADPTGCPYAFAVMHQVKSELEKLPQARGQVRFVSLSFDPERDTPQVLAQYENGHGQQQHVEWTYLTTQSYRDLLPILDGFGQDVGVDIDRATGKAIGTYSHVLKVFLVDGRQNVREIYTTDYLLPAMVLNDIKTLLMEAGPLK